MPFNDVEISEYGNEPIELYTFTRESTTWRFTSSDRDILFQGNNYIATPISRGNIESTQELGKTNLKIYVSRRNSFLNQFISTAPSDVIGIEVTRIHESDPEPAITWRGRIVNVRFEENTAELTCQPLFNSLKRPGLRRSYQINCPHALYGTECKVIKSSFGIVGTLTSVSGNDIVASEFIVSINPTFDPDWFIGGFVEFDNNNITDKRFITNHNNSNGTLTLNIPFPEIAIGNQVTAYPGCAHTTQACSGKFNNILNHGGFPFIPSKNPMDGTPVF